MAEKTWKFGVIVWDENRIEYFGLAQNYDDPLTLQKNAFIVGWKIAKIFDATLHEVTERPT